MRPVMSTLAGCEDDCASGTFSREVRIVVGAVEGLWDSAVLLNNVRVRPSAIIGSAGLL
jgi:hypothetical protein